MRDVFQRIARAAAVLFTADGVNLHLEHGHPDLLGE